LFIVSVFRALALVDVVTNKQKDLFGVQSAADSQAASCKTQASSVVGDNTNNGGIR
jgi:hypothetical protein